MGSEPVLNQRYDSSWALVIGIDRYDDAPALRCAVNDADRFALALVNDLGFDAGHVRVLLDPGPSEPRPYRTIAGPADRAAVEAALFADLEAMDQNDRFLVFFAGHGLSRPSPAGGAPLGYLVPSDGKRDGLTSLIGMDRVTTELNRSCRAKHAIFVLDCCYGGLGAVRDVGSIPTYSAKMITSWTRQLLTAGTSEDVVRDEYRDGNSLFTYFLLDGLTGAADGNGDGVITATELHAFVQGRVGTAGRGVQLPELAVLPDHAPGGDFIFVLAPVTLDPRSVPSLLSPGPRRPQPLPTYMFVDGEAAKLSTARTQIEALARQLSVACGLDGEGPPSDVMTRLEGAAVIPAGTALPLAAFMATFDKVLFRPTEGTAASDLLTAGHQVIVDLQELYGRAQAARAESNRTAPPSSGEDLGAVLGSILTTKAGLDDSGAPLFAMRWVRSTPNWIDLAMDDQWQPLRIDPDVQAVIGQPIPDQGAVGIARTPPGSGPARLMTMPIDASGYPLLSLITIVEPLEQTPVARPDADRDVPFNEAVETVVGRGVSDDGSLRTRYLRAANGELANVLLDPEGRPIRLWFEEPGVEPPRLALGCILAQPDGVVVMIVDKRLRPRWAGIPTDAGPAAAVEDAD